MKKTIKNFIMDVDGVLTTGHFFYSKEGKVFKAFGPDDGDALNLIREKMNIHMISGDKRGFDITVKRVREDMKFPTTLVSSFDRAKWIKENYGLKETVYMGDGIFDPLVFKEVAYSIAPANASLATREEADFVTERKGGEGAVAEAVFHIMKKFFTPIDIHKLSFEKGLGLWK